jgi:hypothetical protein
MVTAPIKPGALVDINDGMINISIGLIACRTIFRLVCWSFHVLGSTHFVLACDNRPRMARLPC